MNADKTVTDFKEFVKAGAKSYSANGAENGDGAKSKRGNVAKYVAFPLLDSRETAVLLNSGGTGGEPKTVELSSHAINALCADGARIIGEKGILTNRFMLSALPYFHGFGLAMGLHAMLSHGGCNVMIPVFRRKFAVRYVQKGKINFIIGVPALYGAMLSHKKFKGRALKKISAAFVGGDFIPRNLFADFNGRMQAADSAARLFEGYGLTETVTVACVNTAKSNKPDTSGKAISGVTVRAFKDGVFVGADSEGELYIRGVTLMNGYYKDRAATDDTFFTDRGGNRWLKTGDWGSVDADGFVRFKQRIKRIIKVSGVSVFPGEIEQAAAAVKGVGAVCAFGVPDRKKGSAIILAVEFFSHDTVAIRAAIEGELKNRLPADAIPKEILFVKKIPLTKINKIDVEKLKEMLGKDI
jgi:long-chain acyl-CoA synthetase